MNYKFQIILANIKNTFEHETAYFTESWSNFLSTTFYTITLLVFIDILYSNINAFAGYSRNEMLFIVFIGQISFYISWGIFSGNIETLSEDIYNGTLDFVLIKPVSSIFFVSFRKLPLISVLRDGLPGTIIIAFLIDWTKLPLTLPSIIWGVIIFIAGQVIWHCIRFISMLPSFWLVNAKQLQSIAGDLQDTHNIPFEGYSQGFRIFFSTLLPIIIVDAMSSSVMLNHSNGIVMTIWALLVAIAFLIIINKLWMVSLRNYTSASS